MSVQLNLFGLPQIVQAGKQQALRLNNPVLLLLYLATKGDWVSRSELAFLFRPDDDESSALKHVRLLLHRARQYDWAEPLEVDKHRARFSVATDIAQFKHALTEQNWPLASRLYTAAFLGDYSSAELPTYSAWIDLERSDLEASYQDSLKQYANDLEQQGHFAGAAQVFADLFSLDPLAEDILQNYLKMLYLSGQRDKALKVFEQFQTKLKLDYDAEPLAETLELQKAISEQRKLEPVVPVKATAPARAKSFNPLPKQSTRFVGRKAELADLKNQLTDESCRLLTLVGLGGSGKSRLALELAQFEAHRFKDGVCFVALAALSSAEAFTTSLAQALGITLAPKQEPLEQVCQFLADKDMLLLLDNFEHLLAAAPILTELLAESDKLKLLVTSRERLNLAAEWLYDVEGLSYPNDTALSIEQLATNDAVALFINSAKRVAPKLLFAEQDIRTIAQISQKLEGLPLALELAASWARIMPVERIAKELSQSYDLLDAEHADLPERHRNLKTIFNKTWAELSEKKRETLAKFSIFQGGASLEAAEEVTGTHFSLLLSLVNESLLKRIPPDRFDIHELLKQLAAQHLDGLKLNELKQHYVTYFSQFLNTYQNRSDKEKLLSRNHLLEDIDNLRKNWKLNLETVNTRALLLSADAMYDLYFNKSFFYEGKTIFQEALSLIEHLHPVNHELMAKVLQSLGVFNMHQGNVHLARQEFEKALISLEKVNNIEEQAYIYKNLGLIAKQQGQLAQAVEELQNSLKLFRQLKDETGLAHALNSLGIILKNMEAFDQARAYLLESLDTFERLELEDDAAIANHNLGSIALMQGDYETAKTHYLSSLRVFEKFDFRHGIAASNTNLGNIELKLGNYQDALGFLDTSIRLKKEVGDLLSLPEPLRQLGLSYRGMKNYHAAISSLLEAISLAIGPHPQSLIIELLVDLADTLIEAGHPFEAQNLLALCLPYSSKDFIRSYISPLQSNLESRLESGMHKVMASEHQTVLEQNLNQIQSTYSMQFP